MKIQQIVKILHAEVFTEREKDLDIKMACGSDLMSDVLAQTKPGSILLTGLTSLQVIYTASTAGVEAVCFVRGKKPLWDTIELAKKKKIVLMGSSFPMFESCGKLYAHGLVGCSEFGGVSKK